MKPKRISYAQAAKRGDLFEPLSPGIPVETACDSHDGDGLIEIEPPTHDELMSILRIAWCAAASPAVRRALDIAKRALELAIGDSAEDKVGRLAQAHSALMGESVNAEQKRQWFLDAIARQRQDGVDPFNEQTVEFCAGQVVEWFTEAFGSHEGLTTDLIAKVLLAPKNVGGRTKEKEKDPCHAVFKALGLPAVGDRSLAVESSNWKKRHPYSPRRTDRLIVEKYLAKTSNGFGVKAVRIRRTEAPTVAND